MSESKIPIITWPSDTTDATLKHYTGTTTEPGSITVTMEVEPGPGFWIVAVEIKDEVSTINWFRVFTSREEAEDYYNQLVKLLPEEYKIYLAKVEKYSPVEVL